MKAGMGPDGSLHEGYEFRFAGVGRIFGEEGLGRIQRGRGCVVGLGGVGSWAAEALVRTGLGELQLVDFDDVCLSNSNRQIQAMSSTVGRMKVQVLKERFLDINPQVHIHADEARLAADTMETLLGPHALHFVIDATDGYREKALLIHYCLQKKIPIITVGGSGGRRDPREVRVTDLAKSHGDRLLQKTRKELRAQYSTGQGGKRFGVTTVFSPEHPVFPGPAGCVSRDPEQRPQLRLDCARGFGALTMVTATFGLFAAWAAIEALLMSEKK